MFYKIHIGLETAENIKGIVNVDEKESITNTCKQYFCTEYGPVATIVMQTNKFHFILFNSNFSNSINRTTFFINRVSAEC